MSMGAMNVVWEGNVSLEEAQRIFDVIADINGSPRRKVFPHIGEPLFFFFDEDEGEQVTMRFKDAGYGEPLPFDEGNES